MSSQIVSIDQTNREECDASGGIRLSYVTRCTDIEDVIFSDDDTVTGFVMKTTGAWARLGFDKDDTAFYNEEGSRNGKKLEVSKSAFMKFDGLTRENIAAANISSEACCVVATHFLNSGLKRVQGITIKNGEWTTDKVESLITPNALSDTGENTDRLEYNIPGSGIKLSPTTELTEDDFDAL